LRSCAPAATLRSNTLRRRCVPACRLDRRGLAGGQGPARALTYTFLRFDFTEQETDMALVSMRQLLDHAAEHGYGLPAFNVNNLEQVQAIMEGAAEVNAPVIMQASAGARKYAGENFLKHLIQAAIESYPQIPIAMHQDHGQSPAVCEGAIKLGFSSVMMDGSLREDGKTVADYDYNWQVTKKVVDMAHAIGVSVEGELGCLGSLETMRGDKEDGHGAEVTMTREMLLTDPDQAADFVRKTQLDALAIAIGTSHGAYKFSRKPTGDILAIERIKEINRRIPNTHLVMHGSSSVPQDLLEEIRKYGGQMKETYGVPVEEIHQTRRAQDQHRHRHPPGDDRGDPQVHARESRALRSARLPQAGARRRQGDLQAALSAVRLRRAGRQDQAAGARHGRAQVPCGRAEPARALSLWFWQEKRTGPQMRPRWFFRRRNDDRARAYSSRLFSLHGDGRGGPEAIALCNSHDLA
jgi:fructose-bisphosphate aldolase, class II